MRNNLILVTAMAVAFAVFTWFLTKQVPLEPTGPSPVVNSGPVEGEVVVYDPLRDGPLSDLVKTIPPEDPAGPRPKSGVVTFIRLPSSAYPHDRRPGVLYCPTSDDPVWQKALLQEAGRSGDVFARLERQIVVRATVFSVRRNVTRDMEVTLPAGTWLLPASSSPQASWVD